MQAWRGKDDGRGESGATKAARRQVHARRQDRTAMPPADKQRDRSPQPNSTAAGVGGVRRSGRPPGLPLKGVPKAAQGGSLSSPRQRNKTSAGSSAGTLQ